VLTAARLLCDCLVARGHHVVSGQLHGMAQRGGSVQASVIVDSGISPMIARGRATCILGFEPVETARALPFMSSHTRVYMNTTPVIPYVLGQRAALGEGTAEYPDVNRLSDSIHAVTPYVHAFDATQCAADVGSIRAMNMVMLGCLLGSGSLPCTADDFWRGVAKRMPPSLQQNNTKAFSIGVKVGEEFLLGEAKP
jgi:indolepyruvate ferredoxin oxidoreductase beta subunit